MTGDWSDEMYLMWLYYMEQRSSTITDERDANWQQEDLKSVGIEN